MDRHVVENIFTSDMKRIMDGKLKEFNKYSPSTKNLISLGLLEEKIKITSSDYLQKNFSLNTLTYKYENNGYKITDFGELLQGIMTDSDINIHFNENYSIPSF